MSSFFDKVKRGVSDTGTKAKILLEANKLKKQISQEQGNIQSLYRNIGQQVFKSYEDQDMKDLEILVNDNCVQIVMAQNRIKDLEVEIEELNESMEEEEARSEILPDTTSIIEEEPIFEILPESPEQEAIEPVPKIIAVAPIQEAGEEEEITPEALQEKRTPQDKTGKMVNEIATTEKEMEIKNTDELAMPMLKCSDCNAQLGPEAKFCTDCGTPVPDIKPVQTIPYNICPYCNGEFNPGSKFCRHCGSPVV